jgi:glycosyltransferase involved in cell wall biosynthesis
MLKNPLTVAWIPDYPIEWMPGLPEAVQALPKRHPATWEMVLLSEFEKNPAIKTHVIALRGKIPRSFAYERNGTVFHILKAAATRRLASYFWLDTLLIRKACREIRPDLVHAWGVEKGAPLIASRMPYPFLMTVQGLLAWYKLMCPLPPYERFLSHVEKVSFRRSKVITTESKFAVEFIRERYPKLSIQQAEHAPNHAFQNVKRNPARHPLHFIFVGTINFRKGADILVRALGKLSAEMDFRLTVISSSQKDYLESIRPEIPEAFWKRVEWKHDVLPHEVARELETPTMLLLPTRADTSPNAVKEAVVAGVPVVATNVGGIPDYVIPGKNGLLVNPGGLNEFIEAIRAACAHPLFREGKVDPETHARMRVYLSPERMAENFLKAYEAVLSV